MSAAPRMQPAEIQHARLLLFDPALAPLIASWVMTGDEAYRLAPNSVPPITPAVVRAWGAQPGRHARLLVDANGTPVGYGELNLLNSERREYWLGHLVIDPARRRCGFGLTLTRGLLERAFLRLGATRVALVVFTDNPAAIQCYRACGMVEEQFELQFFGSYDRHEKLLRMAITRQQWAQFGRR